MLKTDFFEANPFKANDLEMRRSVILRSESGHNADSNLKANSNLEIDSLQRTYSLFTQGLEIDQIAEIQGLSMGAVFRQFEKLILAGKIKDIEGLLPPKREQQIKAVLGMLETELDSLIRAKMGDGCQEEELKLVRALLLSKIGFSQS